MQICFPHWWRRLTPVLLLAGLLLAVVHPVAAQLPRNKAKSIAKAKAKQGLVGQKQLQQNPARGAVLQRFLQMTPEARGKALAKLPPERQRTIMQGLGLMESLSPEERQQLRGRFQAFSDLPQPRRQAVREELKNLRQMSRKERAERLNSDEMKQKFSENELDLINGSVQ